MMKRRPLARRNHCEGGILAALSDVDPNTPPPPKIVAKRQLEVSPLDSPKHSDDEEDAETDSDDDQVDSVSSNSDESESSDGSESEEEEEEEESPVSEVAKVRRRAEKLNINDVFESDEEADEEEGSDIEEEEEYLESEDDYDPSEASANDSEEDEDIDSDYEEDELANKIVGKLMEKSLTAQRKSGTKEKEADSMQSQSSSQNTVCSQKENRRAPESRGPRNASGRGGQQTKSKRSPAKKTNTRKAPASKRSGKSTKNVLGSSVSTCRQDDEDEVVLEAEILSDDEDMDGEDVLEAVVVLGDDKEEDGADQHVDYAVESSFENEDSADDECVRLVDDSPVQETTVGSSDVESENDGSPEASCSESVANDAVSESLIDDLGALNDEGMCVAETPVQEMTCGSSAVESENDESSEASCSESEENDTVLEFSIDNAGGVADEGIRVVDSSMQETCDSSIGESENDDKSEPSCSESEDDGAGCAGFSSYQQRPVNASNSSHIVEQQHESGDEGMVLDEQDRHDCKDLSDNLHHMMEDSLKIACTDAGFDFGTDLFSPASVENLRISDTPEVGAVESLVSPKEAAPSTQCQEEQTKDPFEVDEYCKGVEESSSVDSDSDGALEYSVERSVSEVHFESDGSSPVVLENEKKIEFTTEHHDLAQVKDLSEQTNKKMTSEHSVAAESINDTSRNQSVSVEKLEDESGLEKGMFTLDSADSNVPLSSVVIHCTLNPGSSVDTKTTTVKDRADDHSAHSLRSARSSPAVHSLSRSTGSSGDCRVKRGQWALGKKIGAGAFGVVHLALNKCNGTLMAVKSLRADKSTVRDIEREVDFLRMLKHKNIVRYYGAEIDKQNEKVHIFQEWVAGGSVTEMLSRFGAFSTPVIRSYLSQLLEGLAYLHENEIMHRDIKGSNILVTNDGIVKLTDFGASKKLMSDLMMSHTMRGTPYFMAPEVFEEKYSYSADIWSVGCVVYQMMTGSPPWKHLKLTNPVSLFNHIKRQRGPPPFDVVSGYQEHALDMDVVALKAIVSKCFRHSPNERPTAKDLLGDSFFFEAFSDDISSNEEMGSPTTGWSWEHLRSPIRPKASPSRHTMVAMDSPNRLLSTRRASSGPLEAPFLSPPLPKKPQESSSSPLQSPPPNTSDWPTWARELKKISPLPPETSPDSLVYSSSVADTTSSSPLLGLHLVNSTDSENVALH